MKSKQKQYKNNVKNIYKIEVLISCNTIHTLMYCRLNNYKPLHNMISGIYSQTQSSMMSPSRATVSNILIQ